MPSRGNGMKFAWLWALIALVGGGVLLSGNESVQFVFGRSMAGLIVAALASPAIWLVSRLVTKQKWQWFHWLNCVCFTALIWQIVLSTAGPKIESLVRETTANVSTPAGNSNPELNSVVPANVSGASPAGAAKAEVDAASAANDAVVANGRDAHTATAFITSVDLGSAVGADFKVTAPTVTFKPTDTVYVSIATSTSDPTTTVPGVLVATWWFDKNGTEVKANEASKQVNFTGSGTTDFFIKMVRGLPVGKYKVKVSLNGAVMQVREFEVVAAAGISMNSLSSDYVAKFRGNFALNCSKAMSTGADAMPIDLSLQICSCAAGSLVSSLSEQELRVMDYDTSSALSKMPPHVQRCTDSELPRYMQSHPDFLREYVLKHPEILNQ